MRVGIIRLARSRSPVVRLVFAMLTLVGLSGAPATAQDRLEPENGIFGLHGWHVDYYEKVRATLLEPQLWFLDARMVCLPSFEPEWAVSVSRIKQEDPEGEVSFLHFVEYTGARRKIWNGRGRHRDVEVERSRVPLDRDTALAVQDVWSRMLRQVHYPKSYGGGADGVSYHFSQAGRDGQIWSPVEGSYTRRVVELAEDLKAYALAPPERRDELHWDIRRKAEQLGAVVETPEGRSRRRPYRQRRVGRAR